MKKTATPKVFKSKWFKRLEKEWDKPPKIEILPLKTVDKDKSELIQKLLEYHWEQEWPVVKADIQSRIKTMIHYCYLQGQHTWTGCGKKGRHICKRCGLRAGIAYDPIFAGIAKIEWDKFTL